MTVLLRNWAHKENGVSVEQVNFSRDKIMKKMDVIVVVENREFGTRYNLARHCELTSCHKFETKHFFAK